MKNSHPLEQDELMAYLDGELRPELATIAAAHLERCADCRASADDLRALSRQLAAWEIEMARIEMPTAVSSAVDDHVRAQKKRAAAHPRSWRQILGTRRLVWAGGSLFTLLAMIAFFLTKEPVMMERSRQVGDSPSGLQDQIRANQSPPTAGRGHGGGFGNGHFTPGTGALGKLQKTETDNNGALDSPSVVNVDGRLDGNEEQGQGPKPVPNGPMIVRTAELTLATTNFDSARTSAEEIVKRHGGYIGELGVNAPSNQGRTLTATFRVPAAQLDAAMAELKKLGRVEAESQGGEEVTQQYVDLEARLANARHTEKRLSDLLGQRTGKLSDVLAFEKEIDRVRGEIESMEAQRKSLAKQVTYATLNASVTEIYSQQLQLAPPSTSTRLRNAAVDGYHAVADGIVSVLLFLLSAGPSLLIWGGILFVVGRLIWKRIRRRIA